MCLFRILINGLRLLTIIEWLFATFLRDLSKLISLPWIQVWVRKGNLFWLTILKIKFFTAWHFHCSSVMSYSLYLGDFLVRVECSKQIKCIGIDDRRISFFESHVHFVGSFRFVLAPLSLLQLFCIGLFTWHTVHMLDCFRDVFDVCVLWWVCACKSIFLSLNEKLLASTVKFRSLIDKSHASTQRLPRVSSILSESGFEFSDLKQMKTFCIPCKFFLGQMQQSHGPVRRRFDCFHCEFLPRIY